MIGWHPGYVVSSNLPQGPASSITYTVAVNWTDATGVRSTKTFPNVIPREERWDDGWTTKAVTPGKAVCCVDVDGQVEFWFLGGEHPIPEECP